MHIWSSWPGAVFLAPWNIGNSTSWPHEHLHYMCGDNSQNPLNQRVKQLQRAPMSISCTWARMVELACPQFRTFCACIQGKKANRTFNQNKLSLCTLILMHYNSSNTSWFFGNHSNCSVIVGWNLVLTSLLFSEMTFWSFLRTTLHRQYYTRGKKTPHMWDNIWVSVQTNQSWMPTRS